MPIYNPQQSGGGGGVDGDGYITLYEYDSGDNVTNLLDMNALIFDVSAYEHIIFDIVFQPYNNNWAGGTDQPVLKINNSANGHNTAQVTNYGGDGSYVNTGHIKLTGGASNSVLAIHAEIRKAGVFNSIVSEASMGVISGSVRRSQATAQWLPATPSEITEARITTSFNEQIGMGSNSHIRVRAK